MAQTLYTSSMERQATNTQSMTENSVANVRKKSRSVQLVQKEATNRSHWQKVWRVTRGGQVRVETSMTVSTAVATAAAFININDAFRRCKRHSGRTKRKIMPAITSLRAIRAGQPVFADASWPAAATAASAKSSFASDYAWFRKQCSR